MIYLGNSLEAHIWLFAFYFVKPYIQAEMETKEKSRSQRCFSRVLLKGSGRAEWCWRLNSPPADQLQSWPRKKIEQSALSRLSQEDHTNGW